MTTILLRSARGYGPVFLGTAFAVMCRAYEVDHPNIERKDGRGGNAQGGDGGASGAGDDGGRDPGGDEPGGAGVGGDASSGASGTAGANGGTVGASSGSGGRDRGGSAGTGGSSGAESSGGTGGDAGGGTGGDAGGGTGGESGGGSGPTTPAEPGIYGAVRLLVDGEPRCGGTLLTNDWVLTADQCVKPTDPNSLVIGFGMDATSFHQTQRVIEVRRFPGNDGTDENRGRDLLLLGVENPFEIDGQTSGYYRPVWHLGPDTLFTPQICVGWDLRVATTSPTSRLHQEVIAPFAYDTDVMNGARPAGNRVWWLNTSNDLEQGVLPMPADVGSACFHRYYDIDALSTVHSKNPERRRNDQPNNGREANSVAIGEGEVYAWLRTELFDSTDTPIRFSGSVGGCAKNRDRMEVFGRLEDGTIGWWTWQRTWTARQALPPPGGVSLSGHRPGAYCANSGGIELFATDTGGSIWWQRMSSAEQWNAEWQRVNDATTAVDSGLAVAGVVADHFYVFARATTLELRFAEYNAGWTGNWTNLGGLLNGTPTVRMAQEGHMNIFARNIYDEPWHIWMYGGSWGWWIYNQDAVAYDPAVVTWGYNHLDILSRTPAGTLRHVWNQGGLWAEIADTEVRIPPGHLMAIARQPGTTDLLITQNDGRVWHGFWPRKPR